MISSIAERYGALLQAPSARQNLSHHGELIPKPDPLNKFEASCCRPTGNWGASTPSVMGNLELAECAVGFQLLHTHYTRNGPPQYES